MVQVAYPSESESELLEHLSEDYIKEVNCLQNFCSKNLDIIKDNKVLFLISICRDS